MATETDKRYFIDSDKLSEAALRKKHALENDPGSRVDHMKYMEGMERIESDIMNKVLSEVEDYDYSVYTAQDVNRVLHKDHCTVEDFKVLLSPAAAPFLERMAEKARLETQKHFGNTVYIFTPIYIANYC
nr:2-iminoacetate synthase ThiH [Lachnospiraceae bacterium]